MSHPVEASASGWDKDMEEITKINFARPALTVEDFCGDARQYNIYAQNALHELHYHSNDVFSFVISLVDNSIHNSFIALAINYQTDDGFVIKLRKNLAWSALSLDNRIAELRNMVADLLNKPIEAEKDNEAWVAADNANAGLEAHLVSDYKTTKGKKYFSTRLSAIMAQLESESPEQLANEMFVDRICQTALYQALMEMQNQPQKYTYVQDKLCRVVLAVLIKLDGVREKIPTQIDIPDKQRLLLRVRQNLGLDKIKK